MIQAMIFLWILALIWIVFAVIQDLRSRDIANWLNFSLIIFALGFRFFYSLFSNSGFEFFYQGLIGFGVFFIIGNALYYGRLFAGGDAKLMIALGPVIPYSLNFYQNISFFALFLLLFLFSGAVYTLVWSVVLSIKNSKKFGKEFGRETKKNKHFYGIALIASIAFALLGYYNIWFLVLGAFVFVFSFLYIYSKAVDESSMIQGVKTGQLQEGDWLYQDVRVGRKTIKANWDGLSLNDIRLLKKHKLKVMVRRGIPFSPVFLIGFVVLIYFWWIGLTALLI